MVVAVSESEPPVQLTGGPLLYTYTFSQIILHWASRGTQDGSEHSVNHHSFPAELQIYGYNSDLYPNMTVAREEVRGLRFPSSPLMLSLGVLELIIKGEDTTRGVARVDLIVAHQV